MRTVITIASLWLMSAALGGAQPQTDLADDLAKRAAAIKPAASELRWQQIPWLTDLAEGRHLAQEERRPIFLWVTGDDPLERC